MAAEPSPRDLCKLPAEASDEETLGLVDETPRTRRARRLPVLGMLAALGLLATGIFFLRPSYPPAAAAVDAKAAQGPQGTRLLEDRQFATTAAEHTLAFHKELGLPVDELAPSLRTKLEEELAHEATLRLHHVVDKIESEDEAAGRQLRELRVTPQQWRHAHQVLKALHDERVHDLGSEALQAASMVGDDREAAHQAATQILQGRQRELSELANELIPPEVRDVPKVEGQRDAWEMSIDPKKQQVISQGPLGNWHAAVEVSAQRQLAANGTGLVRGARRLGDETGVPGWLISTLRGLYVSVGALASILLGLLSTLLTSVLGPAGTKAVWWTHMGLDIAECATQFGLTLGVGQLRGWYQWVPCWIMSCFTGLEAIWTFRK